MASQNDHENIPEEDTQVPHPTQPEPEHYEASQVLETVKNLIVELQSFKAKNEQLKKAQEKQQELNEILLQSLQERNNGGKTITKVRRDPEVGDNAERKDSSSQETQKYGIKPKQRVREKWTTWKENSRKLNPPVLMGNQGMEKKWKLGCWTLKSNFKYTITPVT